MKLTIALLLALAAAPGAETLDATFARLDSYTFGAPRETTIAVHDAVLASLGDPAKRRDVAKRLTATLASPSATLEAKRFACRELALAGGAEDVAALAPLLRDEKLRDMARLALEAIPDAAAAAALRDALGKLEGDARVGVIDSLGDLRDRAAADALVPLAGSGSKAVAAASAAALGKIGGLAAASALGALIDGGATDDRTADAALACAESLAAEGRRDAAAALASKLLPSERHRLAAIRVLLLARDSHAVELVYETLAGGDAEASRAVLRFVRELPGEDLTVALANEALVRLAPSAQAAMIDALGECGDPAVEGIAATFVLSPVPEVRLAAIRAFSRLGGDSSVDPLMHLAATAPSSDERAAARAAIDGLRGDSVDAALARCLARNDAALRAEVARSLAARRARNEVPALAAALDNAMGADEIDAICAALGSLGGPRALDALRGAMRSGDAVRSDAAVHALAASPDPAVRGDLEALAATPERNSLAVGGLVRHATGTTAERLAALERALALASSPESKALVVGALGTVPDARAWRLLAPLEADPALRAEVEFASHDIAESLRDSDPATAREIVAAHVDRSGGAVPREDWLATRRAIERHDDYLSAWLVSGPYPGPDPAALLDVPFAPEEALDAAEWRPVDASGGGRPFIVDLSRVVGGGDRAAYLWTQVRVPRDADARLEIGSDDGVKAWIGREVVHANAAFRGLSPGEDRVDVRLREGWNDLVLKVAQGGGGWAACARLRDRSGDRIEGLESRVPDPEPGFTKLFDGASLRGFVVAGREAGFRIQDGAILSDGGKDGGWIRTPRPYSDFVLRLEWKVSKNGNSGVFVRAAAEGDPWVTGHEIQITNEPRGDLHCTGSLYGAVAASPRPDETEDVWHRFEIRCEGTRIVVKTDGVKTVDVDQDDVPAIAGKPLAGFIGLQDSHTGPGGLVAFRNVRVKELPSEPAAQPVPRVLVFSKTAGFRHDSIPAGIAAIQAMGAQVGFAVDATEDAAAFDVANLRNHACVIFLNTTGDVLDAAQQTALEKYVRRGGGWVGVHSAADTEYDWPFYGELVGAYFRSHPAVQPATIRVEDGAHLSTSHLGATWVRTDEWYDYRASPRPAVRVLLALDESTYTGGQMGTDHPIAWCHPVGEGRAFYTGCGHTTESYAERAFLRHLLGGIRYAARR